MLINYQARGPNRRFSSKRGGETLEANLRHIAQAPKPKAGYKLQQT
jgi:hypothetical protein